MAAAPTADLITSRRAVATAPDYRGAERAVDWLSDLDSGSIFGLVGYSVLLGLVFGAIVSVSATRAGMSSRQPSTRGPTATRRRSTTASPTPPSDCSRAR